MNVLVRRSTSKKAFRFVAVFLITVIVVALVGTVTASAAAGGSGDRLTDLFHTKSFRGSSEALQGMSWLGMILHYAISWLSFLGLCLTLYQKFITLLYLSARTMFDNIAEIKKSKMTSGFAGIKGLIQSISDGSSGGSSGGGGLDVVITFVYGLLPNVKAYSDYAESAVAKNKLDENDTPLQYMLKTAIPTIMLVFFLTIGYSGTLGKMYGMVVDGLAEAADYLVTKNVGAWVSKTLHGRDYNSTLGARGSPAYLLGDDIARQIFGMVVSYTDGATEEFKQRVGRAIEEMVVFKMGLYRPAGTPDTFNINDKMDTWDLSAKPLITDTSGVAAADVQVLSYLEGISRVINQNTYISDDIYVIQDLSEFFSLITVNIVPGTSAPLGGTPYPGLGVPPTLVTGSLIDYDMAGSTMMSNCGRGEFTFFLNGIVRMAMPTAIQDHDFLGTTAHVYLNYNSSGISNWLVVPDPDTNFRGPR